ncbi:MAG: single-stranded DNA-binding protein [Eubacterium sp.]|nr:single-stranded DNA-binding protein [Eubacterium sp.]
MNSVELIGRLTRDPEVRYTSGSQMAVASFTIAIDRPQRQDGGEKQTDFPRITVFGRQAETCEKYLKKGRMVAIQGRIQTGSYTNKNGDTVYTTDVVANRVEFIDWGNQNGQGSQGYGQNQGGYSAPQAQSAPAQSQAPAQDDDMPDSFEAIDEDVPF